MNKAELLNALQTARAEWDGLIEKALKTEASGHPPYTEGEYSLKDVIAHVTWYERETADLLRTRTIMAASDNWTQPTVEARNEGVYAEIHDLPLETVVKQSNDVYRQLVEAINGLSEEDINDASRFNNMPWPPSRLVPGNSYEHYQQHIPLIQAWLDGK